MKQRAVIHHSDHRLRSGPSNIHKQKQVIAASFLAFKVYFVTSVTDRAAILNKPGHLSEMRVFSNTHIQCPHFLGT